MGVCTLCCSASHSAVLRTGPLGEGICILYPFVRETGSFGGDCRGGEAGSSGISSVHTLALLSRYACRSWCWGKESEFKGGLTGFQSDGFRCRVVLVDMLPLKSGSLGLRIGIPDGRGLFGLPMVLIGDLSWPPSGEFDLMSVGRLIGPNGDTPS